MRRLSPAILAAIALAVLLMIIVGAMVLRGSSEDDRLTGAQTSQREDPEKLCSSQKTYDLIKRALFRRAAALRGSDQPTFDKLAAYSSLRVEAPLMQQENSKIGSVGCAASLTLDLPPGVAVVGGRRSLQADALYTVQPAADGSGTVVVLANADGIVTPLATLAKMEQPAEEQPDLNGAAANPDAPVDPLAPQPQPQAPAQVDERTPPPTTGNANPSFNCANARTAGEIAVCNDPGLAALDRRTASQFRSAVADATPAQRAILNRTRDSFLRYRDQCPDNGCIAQTSQGRLREIRDIMRGTWQPR